MEEEKIVCCLCGAEPEDEDEAEEFEKYRGKFYCPCCFEDRFARCEDCDKVYPVEKLTYCGEIRICPGCLEDRYPTYDEKQIERETQACYDEMCRAYIGRKTIYNKAGTHDLSWDECDEDALYYHIEVQTGDDGRIVSISRLTCEIMLTESVNSSTWRVGWVDEDTYAYFIEEYLEPILEEEEE